MIKIDLQKAYDSVEWLYLRRVMEEMGFSQLFISWVMECIQTVNSIIVNGEPTITFNAAKGLRQGDPCVTLPICSGNVIFEQKSY